MAITYIPRGKDPIERFTEGFSPYLQMAMQAQLQKRLENEQRQKAMEQLAQMGYAQETPQMVGAPQFLGGGQMPVKPAGNIPKQYQFKPEALKDLGMNFELPGTGITLKSKEQGLTYAPEGFEITGYDKAGKPIIRKKKTDEVDEDYITSIENAVKAIQSGWDVNVVYQKMASAFPGKSAELKRILILQEKETLADIIRAVQGQ